MDGLTITQSQEGFFALCPDTAIRRVTSWQDVTRIADEFFTDQRRMVWDPTVFRACCAAWGEPPHPG